VILSEYDPQKAVPVAEPPTGARWVHELKLDGFRMGVFVSGRGRLGARASKPRSARCARRSIGVDASSRASRSPVSRIDREVLESFVQRT
jgi:ATP-dependent DNA ligase